MTKPSEHFTTIINCQIWPLCQNRCRNSGLDFEDPADNLYAFGKLWATYADEPVFSAFHGTLFGRVGDARLKPLFGYSGFGGFQAKVLANGNVRMRGR